MENTNENYYNNVSSQINDQKLQYEKKQFKKCCNRAGFMTLFSGLFFFAVSFTFLSIFRSVLTLLPILPTQLDALPDCIYSGLTNLVAIGLAGFFFIKVIDKKTEEQLPLKKVKRTTVLSLIIIGFTVCMLSNLLTNLFISSTYNMGIDLNYSGASIPNDSPVEIIFYLLSVAAVPAISEEILFRGAIMSTLRQHSDGFAILVSSLIFGIFHGNFVQFPFAFIVGLVLGWVVVYTNSMLPAVLIHFCNNAFSVICDTISKNAERWHISLTAFNLCVNLFVVTVAFIALILAKKLSEKDKSFLSFKKYDGSLSSKEIKVTFLKSPGIIISMIYLSFLTVTNHIL